MRPVRFNVGSSGRWLFSSWSSSLRSLVVVYEALRTTLETFSSVMLPDLAQSMQTKHAMYANATCDAPKVTTTATPKTTPKTVSDPMPAEGLLARKRCLGMSPIADDENAINFDTMATMDGPWTKILTPPEAPPEVKFVEASFDSFVDARDDDPATKQSRDLDMDELIRRPTIAGPFRALRARAP